MTTMTEIASAVLMIEANLADLDELLSRATPDQLELEPALTARSILGTAGMGLGQCRERLDDLIGDALAQPSLVVENIGMVKRHPRKKRTAWDKDLYRAVLDTRLVDTETGEVKDETPLDKVLACWNLGAPRVTVLRARGIDPEEWCSTEVRPGWQIEIK